MEFGWGTYSFKGVVEQFKETIDFFSAGGVPLRSSINLTLASQEVEFQSNRSPSPSIDRQPRPDPVATPPDAAASDVANQLGDPRAARGIAAANGADSLRFGAGVSLAVGGEVTLAAAASFSVGGGVGIGGGFGAGGGIGFGAGGGASSGVSGGVSFGTGAGVGVGVSIAATAGPAFAGLRVSTPAVTVQLADARAALLPAPRVVGVASFGPGGRAQVSGGSSLSADVGAGARLDARIGFGD